MIGFESGAPLAVTQIGRRTWETTAPLIFHGRAGSVSVPVGSRTDWVSVPAVLSWLVGRMTAAPAAVVHDYCWRCLCPLGLMAYRDADRLLVEMLWALRVSLPSRWLMWAAVRWAAITTRDGGAAGASRDLPKLVAVTVPGLLLAAPAVLLLPSTLLLALANWVLKPRS